MRFPMKRVVGFLVPGIAAALIASGSVSAADGAAYTVTDLGTLGGVGSVATGLNNRGEVVGFATRSDGLVGFLYSGGSLHELPLVPYAINDRGDIVGESYRFGGVSSHAALFTAGTLVDLGTLPFGNHSVAYAINNNQQIVGNSLRAGLGTGSDHAFLWEMGSMRDLGVLAPDYSIAQRINGRGDVVGSSTNPVSNSLHGFLYSNGLMRDLGTLGGRASQALGINDDGVIVGVASTPSDDTHPFVYHDGSMTDLGLSDGFLQGVAWSINAGGDIVGTEDKMVFLSSHAFIHTHGTTTDLNDLISADSGWVLQEANTINDIGQIVGYGRFEGQQRAFLLTPVVPAQPPSVTPSISGTLGNNGWYISNVDVSWTVSGGDLPITATTGCDPVSITADTIGVTLTCTATSAGGSTTASVDVKRDATAPVVTYAGNHGSYTIDQAVNITCAASDPVPGSGLESTTCADADGPAYSFGVGDHTLSATAHDRAGNTGGNATTFTVVATPASLCALTVQFVQATGKKRGAGAVPTGACHGLDELAARPSPQARSALINAYQHSIGGLAQAGWFTTDQATTLVQLSNALSTPA
jgi:probable HAF family extracellular repeat protein